MSNPNYDAAPPATTTTTAPASGSGRKISTILGLILAALLVIALIVFVTQNTEQVHIEFFGLNLDMAQGVALLLAAVVGFLIALLGSGILRLRRKVRDRHR
ncbi:LapA family protein [Williamsia muralis]|uniref:lipopolysaccharide assembly protein LapA domain-containing protein n=1 Tax=Williamsia marianensis TaxID=85044 RepID=UPI000DE797CC|nr:LapA family protein [Williamsia marianensis]PVY28473.1 putative integral membrane protein [Williamsia marianensis]